MEVGDLELIIRVDVHKDLEKGLCSAMETEDQVEGGLFLDVVVVQSAPILQLLSSGDKSLLAGRGGCLPYPGSWPSRYRWYPMTLPPT